MSTIVGPKLDATPAAWHLVYDAGFNVIGVGSDAFVAPAPGFVTRLGVRAIGNPRTLVVLALHAAGPNGAPVDLLGRSNPVAVTSAAGAGVEPAVAWTDPDLSPAGTAIRLDAGQRFVVTAQVYGQPAGFAVVPGEATHHLRRTPSGYPTDPFDPAASGPGPMLAAYVVFDEDRPPGAPTDLAPAAGAAFNSPVPVFAGTFADPDAPAPWGDRLREYRIEVRRAGESALLWGGPAATFTATDAERAARRFSRPYNGPSLTPGGHEWRAVVADDALTYGEPSAWRGFALNATGAVDVGAALPAGKVDGDPALIAWSATWTHPQGSAADRARVLLYRGGTLVKTGADAALSPAVAVGAALTIPAAAAGIGRLDPGAYEARIAARDALGGQWSPPSAPFVFSINAPPTTPANLQPPNGAASSAPPKLEWLSRDPDRDDVEGVDTVWDVRLYAPSGTLLRTVVASADHPGFAYDAALGGASLHLAGADLVSGYQAYGWEVQGRDLSAGARGVSAPSRRQAFRYQPGPTVTVTRPGDGATFSGSTPLYVATAPDLRRARFRVHRADAPDPFYDSGERAAAAIGTAEHEQKPGYLTDGGAYDLVVQAWNGANQEGTSLRVPFSVAYAPPRGVADPRASPHAYPGDPEPTGVLLSWEETDYPPGRFEHYEITRRRADEEPDDRLVRRRLRNPGQTRWTDPHPPGGAHVYGVAQAVREGPDVRRSEVAEIVGPELDLGWAAVVLVSVDDPAGVRLCLWVSRGNADPEPESSRPSGSSPVVTWGSGGIPIPVLGNGSGPREWSFSGLALIDDAEGSAVAKLAALEAMAGNGRVVSARTRGRRMFGEITAVTDRGYRYGPAGRGYEVDVTVAERFYDESASA